MSASNPRVLLAVDVRRDAGCFAGAGCLQQLLCPAAPGSGPAAASDRGAGVAGPARGHELVFARKPPFLAEICEAGRVPWRDCGAIGPQRTRPAGRGAASNPPGCPVAADRSTWPSGEGSPSGGLPRAGWSGGCRSNPRRGRLAASTTRATGRANPSALRLRTRSSPRGSSPWLADSIAGCARRAAASDASAARSRGPSSDTRSPAGACRYYASVSLEGSPNSTEQCSTLYRTPRGWLNRYRWP